MSLVIYRLVQKDSCKDIDNLHGCEDSNIKNYTLIVCKVLSFQDGLFGKYIHAPT